MPSKVLVVEDMHPLRTLLGITLTQEGFEVRFASDGREAWRIAQEETFDLVITDHSMPYLSGAELAAKLSKAHPTLPVIMLTGYAQSGGELPPGVALVLSKPISPSALQLALRTLLKSRLE